jgi:alpha-galactosidase
VTPGIPVEACNKNTPIEGTRYHARDIADMSRFETNYNFGPN